MRGWIRYPTPPERSDPNIPVPGPVARPSLTLCSQMVTPAWLGYGTCAERWDHGHASEGLAVRRTRTAQEPRVLGGRGHDHRPWHRRMHLHLQRRERCPAAAVAVLGLSAAGHRLGRTARAQRPRLAVLAARLP